MLSLDTVQNYLRPIADFLMVFNSSINVVIYCIFKKEFREKFSQLYLQCSWKKKNTPKPLPAPMEKSMIPMIRAQLPKTSVEMTFASKERLQHETPFIYHPALKNVNNATLLLEANRLADIIPSSSDSRDLVETSQETEQGDTSNSKDVSVSLRESTISIETMGAVLPNTSVELAEITEKQKQDIYKFNQEKGQELQALIVPESSEEYKSGNIDVHIEARKAIEDNSASDGNIKKVNENITSENKTSSKNLCSKSIENSDVSTNRHTFSSKDTILESITDLNEVESYPTTKKQANDLAKKIIADVLQAVAERTTEVEIRNNFCTIVEDATSEAKTEILPIKNTIDETTDDETIENSGRKNDVGVKTEL